LAQRCQELAGRKNPQQTSRTIADCFDEEQVLLNTVKAEFDGYVEKMLRVSTGLTHEISRTECYP
jgi:hypothetical protein